MFPMCPPKMIAAGSPQTAVRPPRHFPVEARRAGIKERTRRSAEYAYEAGQHKRKPRRRPRVSRGVERALKREPRSTASRAMLSRHAKRVASRRSAAAPPRRRVK